MSTPRLAEPDEVEWNTPFDRPEVDDLFTLDTCPQPLGHIRELLGLAPHEERRLPPLLSDEPLAPASAGRAPAYA